MRALMLLVFLSFITGFTAFSENTKEGPTIKVAVIDTGKSYAKGIELCGSIDLTGRSLDHTDRHGHGTNVAYLIDKYAGGVKYCQLPINYYGSGDNSAKSNIAFNLAISYGVDIINYSGGGLERDNVECGLIKTALDRGIIIVAAAGNEGRDLAEQAYYPAMCDDRVVVVGCSNLEDSNYGKVDFTYKCKSVGKPAMSGTSQATAIITGKLVNKLYKERKNGNRKNRTSRSGK